MFPLFFGFFMYLPAHNVLVVLLLVLLLYSAGYALCNIQKIKQVLKSMIVFVSLEGLFCLWVLFPFFYIIIQQNGALISQSSVMFGTAWAEWAQYGGAVIRVMAINFQLETSTAFYFSPGIIIWLVNLLFPIIAFSALLIKPKSKMVVYFALIAIIGIFINVGPNPPWGWIYQWALNNFSILRGFRTVGHTMTIIALAYSVLIGITISEIYLSIQHHFSKSEKLPKRIASKGLLKGSMQGNTNGIGKLSQSISSNLLFLSVIVLIIIALLSSFRSVGRTVTIISFVASILISVGIIISKTYLNIQRYFHKIGKFSKGIASVALVLSMVVLISINGWSIVTGAYFNTPTAHPNNVMHEIPSSYYMIDNWLNGQDSSQDYRVLALPSSVPINEDPSSAASNDWIWPDGHFSGSNVVPFIISKPVIHAPVGREGVISPIIFSTYDALEKKNFGEIVKLAGLLNTKYILVDSYVIRLGNLAKFRAIAEQGEPVQVYNGTQLYDITKYCLLNADLETWADGNPSSWTNPTGKGSQETNIVYSGLSSLKLEANSNVFQSVSIDSKGTYLSFAYYLSPLNSSYYDYFGLAFNVHFADDTIIQYTVEPSNFEDTSSCKYIALPRVSGQWVNVTMNIGDDVYNKYGSYKQIGSMGLHLLNSGDVPPVYFDSIKILSNLRADNLGVKNVVTYDKLSLYKIDDEHVFPRVYATSKSILINGSENQLVEFLNMNNFTSKKPLLLLSDQLNPSNLRDIQGLKLDENSDVSFTFQQVDPTKYIVHVTTSKPFFLVLSTSFDPEWIAYIDGKEVNMHLEANGYANAWLVNKTGSFDIVLKYKIQDYYYITIIIFLSTLIGCIVYIKKDWIRKLITKFRTHENLN